jgi:hypothetical protein
MTLLILMGGIFLPRGSYGVPYGARGAVCSHASRLAILANSSVAVP